MTSTPGRRPWAWWGWPALPVVGLALVLYLPALGVETLRHPLEAKYALAARGMVRGGPLLVARLFGELYPDKPPLYFWAVAGLGALTGGIDEFTARLPAVVGAVGALLATLALGTSLFGRRAGLIAATVLATSGLFFWYARQGHPDQFLTAWVTVACALWWQARQAVVGRNSRALAALAYAAMALGVMSKGLLGLLIPMLGFALFLALVGPPSRILPGLRLGVGLPVFLAVLLCWYGPAVARHGTGYFYETVVHQHLVRYAHTWVHRGPWYYYFGEFTAGFFPWVLFVPGAAWLGWRRAGPAFRFPLSWFAVGFVFLSLSTSKRGAYLLPLYPAAALMVGWLLDRVTGRAGAGSERSYDPPGAIDGRWVGVPLAVLAATAVALAGLVAVLPRRLVPGNMVDTLMPSSPGAVVAACGLLLSGAALVWLPWRRGARAAAVGTVVAVQALVLIGVAVVRGPQYEARFPAREFAARVRAAVPGGTPLLSLLGDYNFIVAFYADRPIVPLPDPGAMVAAAREHARLALVDDRSGDVLGRPDAVILEEVRLGPRRVVLIRLGPTG